MGRANCFSTNDLRSGYHQVRIKNVDVSKRAFRTRYGLFEYFVTLFVLTGEPGYFQNVMNNSFRTYLEEFVLVYLDDVVVYSKENLVKI